MNLARVDTARVVVSMSHALVDAVDGVKVLPGGVHGEPLGLVEARGRADGVGRPRRVGRARDGRDGARRERERADRVVVRVADEEAAVDVERKTFRLAEARVCTGGVGRARDVERAGEHRDGGALDVDGPDGVVLGVGEVERLAGEGDSAGRVEDRRRADAVPGARDAVVAGERRDGAGREIDGAHDVAVGHVEVAFSIAGQRPGLREMSRGQSSVHPARSARPAGDEVEAAERRAGADPHAGGPAFAGAARDEPSQSEDDDGLPRALDEPGAGRARRRREGFSVRHRA